MMHVRRDGSERSQMTLLGNALRRSRDSIKGDFRIQTDVYVVNASGGHRTNGYRLMRLADEQNDDRLMPQNDLLQDDCGIDLTMLHGDTPF